MKHCIESTIDFEYVNYGFILRLWIAHKELPADFDMEGRILGRFHDWLKIGLKDVNQENYPSYCQRQAEKFKRIIEYFEDIFWVNAVQVKEIVTAPPQFGAMAYFVEF